MGRRPRALLSVAKREILGSDGQSVQETQFGTVHNRIHHNTPKPSPLGNQLSPDLGALTTLRLHDRGRALVIGETIPARARVWRIDVDSGSVVPTRPARTKSYHTIIEPTPPQHSTGPSLEKNNTKMCYIVKRKRKKKKVSPCASQIIRPI